MVEEENLLRGSSRHVLLALSCSVMLLTALVIGCNSNLPGRAYAAAGRTTTVSGSATSSPESGPAGATIVVNGSNFAATSEQVIFGYSLDPNCHGYVPINGANSHPTVAGGSFSGWFVWPTGTAESTYNVCVIVGNAVVHANTYTVLSSRAPQISTNKAAYTVGETVNIAGSYFLPGGITITFTLQDASGQAIGDVGSAASDNKGNFAATFKLPARANGSDMIVATAGSGTPSPINVTSNTFTVYKASAKATPIATATPIPTPTPLSHMPTATASPTALPGRVIVAYPGASPFPTPVLATPVPTTNTASLQRQTATFSCVAVLIIAGLLAVLGMLVFVVLRMLNTYPATSGRASPSAAVEARRWSRSFEDDAPEDMDAMPIADQPTQVYKSFGLLPDHRI